MAVRSAAEFLEVRVTTPDEETALRIARSLVEERLAACVQCVPGLRSIFSWKGAIEDAREVLLLVKVRRSSFDAVRAKVEELHPYEVPEIVGVALAAGNPAYLAWLEEETADGAGSGPDDR